MRSTPRLFLAIREASGAMPPVGRHPRPGGLRRCARAAFVAAAAAVIAACAHSPGPFVWADQLPATAPTASVYIIGSGDLLSVQVWDQDRMSGRVRVRSDGRVSLPLIGDVPIVGRTVEDAARTIERELDSAQLVVKPKVTVLLEESNPLSISVLGAVGHPGTYRLESGSGVAEALASAGGLTDYAKRDRIFVVRKVPEPMRVRFRFEDVTRGVGRAAQFRLQSGDVVVAE